MGLTPRENKKYLSILSSDGTLRMKVQEDTPGAEKRTYEDPQTKEIKTKWELVYKNLSGYIQNIIFRDGDYGEQLVITVSDNSPDSEDYNLAIAMQSSFANDILEKLPNIDYDKPVILSPYAFEANGKNKRGVTITQDGDKKTSFFFDIAEKKGTNGIPKPKKVTEKMTKDDWQIFFAEKRVFLKEYTVKHCPKYNAILPTSPKIEYPEETINPEDIPF